MGKSHFLIRSSRIKISFFTIFLLWVGVILCTPVSYADDREKLKSVQQNIVNKEREVLQQKRQREKLLSQLQSQEQEIASVGAKLHDTQKRLTQLMAQITGLNDSVSQLERQQTKEKRELSEQLDAMFRLGKHGGIQTLLSGEDARREQRLQAYYGYLNQVRQQTITQLQQTGQQLAERKQQLQASKSSEQQFFEQQRVQQVKFQQARDARKKTLQQLEFSIVQGQQQLVQLRQNEVRLRDSITKAEATAREQAERDAREARQLRQRQQQAIKDGGSYQANDSERALIARTDGLGKPQGQAIWPVQGPLLHHYGDLIQGELRWKGIAIGAATGSEVKAIADGRVILVDWLQGYGLVIVIEHGKGDMSLYGYNQSALAKVGELVHAGQAVALVGDSGGQGQSALYFEIRRQGQALNPLSWLKK